MSSLPLLLGYETLIRIQNSPVVNGIANWIQEIMHLLGFWGRITVVLLIILLCISTIYRDKKQGIRIKKGYMIGMIAESTVYAFLLAPLVTIVFFGYRLNIFEQNGYGFTTELAMCLGAGFYEEFMFRFLLIGFPFVLLDNMYPERKVYGTKFLIFVLSAALFSYVHYIGTYADIFTWSSFIFRMGAGIVLGIIFLLRGFGIAAWTHAIYDILVTFNLFK
ncbi:MAG: CPBP family glutamic-type intramembrane protease [Bacteroidia bacterium]|nr:CPBP family glutamic-type intramembrane protease [Bacteroidia bacterium]MDW8347306.1 CPBP family glutamic-type intramembrane protease [Bacteroidia bacterium]